MSCTIVPAIISLLPRAAAQTDLFEYHLAHEIRIPGRVAGVSFTNGGVSLIFATEAGEIREIMLPSGDSRLLFSSSTHTQNFGAAAAGRLVVLSSPNGNVRMVGLEPGGQFLTHRVHGHPTALAVSMDGNAVALASNDGNVSILETTAGTLLRTLETPDRKPLIGLRFEFGRPVLLGVSETGGVVEWDLNNGHVLRQWRDPQPVTYAMDVSPDGVLAIATEERALAKGNPMREAHPADFFRDNRIKLYDLNRGSVIKEIAGIDGEITAMSISPDSRFLAGIRQRARGAFLTVYDLVRGADVVSLPARDESRVCTFSPDGRWLAAVLPSGNLGLFAVEGVQQSTSAASLAGAKIRITGGTTTPLLASAQHGTIAVLDFFEGQVPPGTGRIVADMLRNHLARVKTLTLVERDRIQRIMQEQNFQNSDRVDSKGVARIGQILNAGKMLLGAVSKLGSSYTITVQLVDVQTGAVEGVREVLCQRCGPEDLPEAIAVLSSAVIPPNGG